MMRNHFVNEESTSGDNEENSEMADINHVSILDDVIHEHEKEVFTSYFIAALYSEIPEECNVEK